MKLITCEKTGLNYRPGTGDEDVIKEMSEYKILFDNCKDKVCFDAGGNIGVTTYFLLKNGAKHVTVYEPEPDNFVVLSSQPLDKARVTLVNAGLGEADGIMDFYQSKIRAGKKTCMGRHSRLPIKGRNHIQVPMVDFAKEINRIKPDIVKCDIESGEFFIDLPKNLPSSVRYLAIEIHCKSKEQEADDLLKWCLTEFDVLYRKDMISWGKQDTYILVLKRK